EEESKDFHINSDTIIDEKTDPIHAITGNGFYPGYLTLIKAKDGMYDATQPEITSESGVEVDPSQALPGSSMWINFCIEVSNPNNATMKNPQVYFLIPAGLIY